MHLSRPIIPALALVVLSTVLGACDQGSSGAEEPAQPVRGTQVRVLDNEFDPEVLQVSAGETVTWQWEGSANHNVVGEGFESETKRSGDFTHTFAEPGDHDYVCTLHPAMTGTVVVSDS